MTVSAPARVAVVPVAASAALRDLLAGKPREGVLLGAGEHGAWARLGDTVVVLLPTGATRGPNAVEVPPALLLRLEPGAVCRAYAGGLDLAEWRVEIRGWWDPRPTLPRIDPSALRAQAAALRGRFVPAADEGLGSALDAADAAAAIAAAGNLIGKGPGLTPLGDDVLAGTLAASLLLGEATGNRSLVRLLAGVIPGICALARERTTALSATLLCHAGRGEVDDASAGLLRALCGRGDPEAAIDSLLALGHTSGTGLATGLLAGAAAAGGAP
jgi:hypothetical protein